MTDTLVASILANKKEIFETEFYERDDINIRFDNGYTPLMIASLNDRIDIVKFLIKFGVDVNEKNNDGETALDMATQINSKQLVELFIEHKSKDSSISQIFTALKNKNYEIIKLFIDNDYGINSVNKDDLTPLSIIIKNIVKPVIKKEEYHHKINNFLTTPCYSQHIKFPIINDNHIFTEPLKNNKSLNSEMLEYLNLKHPEEHKLFTEYLNLKQSKELMLFTDSLNFKDSDSIIEIIKLLINNGVDVKCNDNMPLKLALNHQYNYITKLLINNGANIKDDISLLITLCKTENYDIIELFIEKGVSFNTDVIVKMLLWDYLYENKDITMIKYFKKQEVNFNIMNHKDVSLSQLIVKGKYKKIVMLFEEQNEHLKDRFGSDYFYYQDLDKNIVKQNMLKHGMALLLLLN